MYLCMYIKVLEFWETRGTCSLRKKFCLPLVMNIFGVQRDRFLAPQEVESAYYFIS